MPQSVVVAVLGAGAVGARVVRQLASSPMVSAVAVADRDHSRALRVAADVAGPADVRAVDVDGWGQGADVGVLAHQPGAHRLEAERLLALGTSVVSVSGALADVRGLLAMDAEAKERRCSVVAGAAFAPGLSCVMAMRTATAFDQVEEVHLASMGTGGSACASARSRSMRGQVLEWYDGVWVPRRAGSGRELCWFPEPVGGVDCYRAASADAAVLVPALPGVARVTARVGTSRRERLKAHLPPLGRRRPEGALGGLRVEVRGRKGEVSTTAVVGAVDRPDAAAGAVAAVAAVTVGQGLLKRTGAGGLAALADPVPFLAELARLGVKVAVFEGTATSGPPVGAAPGAG